MSDHRGRAEHWRLRLEPRAPQHLEQVERLTIRATEELVDLRGLESLRLTSSVDLIENAALQTLDAPIGVAELSVGDNPQLRSIAGLARVRLSAFDSGIHPTVEIERNPMLHNRCDDHASDGSGAICSETKPSAGTISARPSSPITARAATARR